MTGYLRQKHDVVIAEKRVETTLSLLSPRFRVQRRTWTTRAENLIPYRPDYFGYKLHIDQNENLKVCCLRFMLKLLIYKQLGLSYLKIFVLIFATFQFFIFWFMTDFVKWKLQFRNCLFFFIWNEKLNYKKHLSSFNINYYMKKWKTKKILFKSVYQKYNSFFDLKTKWILKFLSFFIFLFHY